MGIKCVRTENIYKGLGVIYKITNIVNGKVYIGQSINFMKRISSYKNNSCYNQTKIHRAISKYSWNSFSVEILFKYNMKNPDRTCIALDAMEKFCIKKYSSIENGYNIKTGGGNGIPSKDSIEKGRISRMNISNDTRLKMSNSQKNRTDMMDLINKLSEKNKKPIIQYTLDGEFIREWDSAVDAAKILGGKYRSIGKACRHKTKSSRGFLWDYKKI